MHKTITIFEVYFLTSKVTLPITLRPTIREKMQRLPLKEAQWWL